MQVFGAFFLFLKKASRTTMPFEKKILLIHVFFQKREIGKTFAQQRGYEICIHIL